MTPDRININGVYYRKETFQKRVEEIQEAIEKSAELYEVEELPDKPIKPRFFERTWDGKIIDKRRIKPTFCRAFINNFSFPKSLKELENIISRGYFDIEDLLSYTEVGWTVPKWASAGDICLFMHAKYAKSTISRLKTELRNSKKLFESTGNHKDADSHNEANKYFHDFDTMMAWLDRGKALHDQYGGKIIAIGRVVDGPIYEDNVDQDAHWGSRIYADVGEIWHLDNPIDISECNSVITVSRQSAITPLFGELYDTLKQLVLKKNPNAPEFFLSAKTGDMPLSKMNRDNWLRISYEYRYSFLLEAQFRAYYVDFFLKELGDQRKVFSECRCIKPGVTNLSRVDNVIRFQGRYLPVEVKLSVPCEIDLPGQVTKYCNDTTVYLTKDEKRSADGTLFYYNHVLVIDTNNLFLYDDRTAVVEDIYNLDSIRAIGDIKDFRIKLADMLVGEYPALKVKSGQRNLKRGKA